MDVINKLFSGAQLILLLRDVVFLSLTIKTFMANSIATEAHLPTQ
jgi:hypothetical protein